MAIEGLAIYGKGDNAVGTGTLKLAANRATLSYKEPGSSTYGPPVAISSGDDSKIVTVYGSDLKAYVLPFIQDFLSLPQVESTLDITCANEFTHYTISTPMDVYGDGANGLPGVRLQFVASDGTKNSIGFASTVFTFVQAFMAGAKKVVQASFFLPIYDSTPDQPFVGEVWLWGQDAHGDTILGKFNLNLGLSTDAKTVQTFDVNGGIGVSSKNWRVKWKENTAGIITQVLMKEDVSEEETTMTATASLSNQNYSDFELSLAGKPQNLTAKLADSFVGTQLQETYQVQYQEFLPRPDLGADIYDSVYSMYDKGILITAVKTVFAPVVVLSGLAVKKPTQLRDQYLLAIQSGQAVTAEGMVYITCDNDEEGALAYSLLKGGATLNDLRGVGFPLQKAVTLLGMWYFQSDPIREAAVAEKAAFDLLKTKTLSQMMSIITYGYNGGSNPPFVFNGIQTLLPTLRTQMSEADRGRFVTYMQENWA